MGRELRPVFVCDWCKRESPPGPSRGRPSASSVATPDDAPVGWERTYDAGGPLLCEHCSGARRHALDVVEGQCRERAK